MNIIELSDNLLKVYAEMSATFSEYQKSVNLPCLEGCGKCCLNPDIEASVLEMLPFAIKIYREGKLEEWLLKMGENSKNSCVLFEGDETGKGRCGSYNERPGLCRMFGVAGLKNKEQVYHLSICKFIKESNPEASAKVVTDLTLRKPPLMTEHSAQLAHLGDSFLQRRFPINEAIQQALEKVAFCAWYQEI
jgi:uncharacterized protein